MSNIFITDIIGTGAYAVPASDAALAAATSGFDTILSGVANLAYDRVLAWVEDAGGPGGAEGNRTLNCLVEKFTYSGEECPDETEVDTMTAAIEAALEADANITSVDQQQVHIFQAGAYFLWQRDAAGGFLYPNTITDDVAVGGHVAPTGKWFDDGDLVLGGNTMVGTEKLLVIGSQLIDQNGNGYGLDIDSEATGQPLVNLQPLLANTRGDIAFGTTRTSDPSGPSEGDLWYESTSGELKFRKSASTVEVRNAIKLQNYAVAPTAPTNQYVLAWNGTASRWEPTSMSALPGPYYGQVTSMTTATTTSATDVAMTGMTITTPPAGTYMVFFSTTFQHSNNNQTIYVSIYAGGTQQAYSEKMIQSPRWVNAGYMGYTQAIVTVNGAQNIEIRWRTTGGTASALSRSLMIVRVS